MSFSDHLFLILRFRTGPNSFGSPSPLPPPFFEKVKEKFHLIAHASQYPHFLGGGGFFIFFKKLSICSSMHDWGTMSIFVCFLVLLDESEH